MRTTRVSIAAAIVFGLAFVAVLVANAVVNEQAAVEELNRKALERAEFQGRILATGVESALSAGDSVARTLAGVLTALLHERGIEQAVADPQLRRAAQNEILINDAIEEVVLYHANGEEVWRTSPSSRTSARNSKSVLDLVRSPASSGLALVSNREDGTAAAVLARRISPDDGSGVVVIATIIRLGHDLRQGLIGTIPDIDALRLDSVGGELILTEVLNEQSSAAALWTERPLETTRDVLTGIAGGTHRVSTRDTAVASIQVDGYPVIASGFYDKSGELRERRMHTLTVGSLITLLGAAATALFVILLRRSAREAHLMESQVEELSGDVAQLEQRDEERNLLMREVHHRVKNNLLIISSVVRMIRDGGGPFTSETLQDIESRIAAVQQVHDTLYHAVDLSELVRIDRYLESLVGTLMSGVANSRVHTSVRVEAVELPARTAITLGLLSTEIVTNAIKHGVVDGGAIRITGRVRPSGLEIEYWNDGRPYDGSTPGLGTMLINTLVAQLNGTLELDTEDGTRWTLVFDPKPGENA